MDKVAERWLDAADRYRIATEIGFYNPNRKDVHPHEDQITELEKLLKKFFDWNNPQWQAARKLLQQSGKEVELVRQQKDGLLVKYMLNSAGFWVVAEHGYLLESVHQLLHPRQKLSIRIVATLLVDEAAFLGLYETEELMAFVIGKIDEVAENAPDGP